MRSVSLFTLLAAAALAGSGCGDDVGPLGAIVGGPCAVYQDCAAGSACLTDSDFPGGLCTLYCAYNEQCPAGSACVDKKGGICMSSCINNQDCRDRYYCEIKKRKDKLGEALVCAKD